MLRIRSTWACMLLASVMTCATSGKDNDSVNGGVCTQDTVFCQKGTKWDPVQCTCIQLAGAAGADGADDSGACPAKTCAKGASWDPSSCQCVPDGAGDANCGTETCTSGEVCCQVPSGPSSVCTTRCVKGQCPTAPCNSGDAAPPPTDAKGTSDAGSDSSDGADGCCPSNWMLYPCVFPDGKDGLHCHDPMVACMTSTTCGEGCDKVVSGLCH